MHKYSLGGRPRPRPSPPRSFLRSFVPSFLSILTSITSIFIGSGINRTERPAGLLLLLLNAMCARTHGARKHGAAEQQNKRKEGIKEGNKEGGRGLDSFTHSPQRRETFAAMPPGRTDEEEEASLVGAARRFLCTRCTQAASSRITMPGSAAAGVSQERSCKYDGLFV